MSVPARRPRLRQWVQRCRRLPLKTRLTLAALAGVPLGLLTYEIVYVLNPLDRRASTSWLLAFLIGVARQHALHRWFTFENRSPYWPSLARCYVVDIGSAIFGTALNWLLTEVWDINHHLAWLVCLLATAGVSIAFLGSYVFPARGKSGR